MNLSQLHNVLLLGFLGGYVSMASGGGVENSKLNTTYLFSEADNLFHVTVATATADMKGRSFDGSNTGNGAPDTEIVISELGFKHDLNDQWTLGVLYHQPYTSNVSYSEGLYQGLKAEWQSNSLAGVLNYQIDDTFSVYGGLSAVRNEKTEVNFNPEVVSLMVGQAVPLGYSMKNTNKDVGVRYVLGGSYQIPEIALLTTLTYQSSFNRNIKGKESGVFGDRESSIKVKMPQTLTLEFETGIAEDKLIYGSVRWAEWSKFIVAPFLFKEVTGEDLVTFKDSVSYLLGYAQVLTPQLVGSVFIGYEEPEGGSLSVLSPYDGYKSIGVGLRYEAAKSLMLSVGMEYAQGRDGTDDFGTEFKGIDSLGVGLTLDYAL